MEPDLTDFSELSTRARNILRSAGIKSRDELLLKMTNDRTCLLRILRCGRETDKEIKNWLGPIPSRRRVGIPEREVEAIRHPMRAIEAILSGVE